jgi:hypothetical protein
MRIDEFAWLEKIVDKLWSKHRVTTDEAEEAFLNRPQIRWQESGHNPDENLYAAYGRTNEGRYLVVYFILKTNGHTAVVVSARGMDSAERRRYERK